jgi:hypothetical protein
MSDLVVTARSQRRMLEPVERALAGERRAVGPLRLEPVGEQREHRVVAQLVVIVHVLVAERDAHDPLPDQGRQGVHHLVLLAVVLEARGDPLDQPDGSISVPQQQTAGVRSHCAAVERRHHPPPAKSLQTRTVRRYTLSASDPADESGKCLSQQHYLRFPGPMHPLP